MKVLLLQLLSILTILSSVASGKTECRLSSLPPWSHKVLAGGCSRALAQAVLYPVDALRTLAQTRDGRTLADVGTGALIKGCGQTSSFALFTGAFQFGIYGIYDLYLVGLSDGWMMGTFLVQTRLPGVS